MDNLLDTFAVGPMCPAEWTIVDTNLEGACSLDVTWEKSELGRMGAILGVGWRTRAAFKLDLVVVKSDTSNVKVFFNRGDGTFHTAEDHEVGMAPSSIAAADLNGDGRPDLVTVIGRRPRERAARSGHRRVQPGQDLC